jgi:ribosomal protein L18E
MIIDCYISQTCSSEAALIKNITEALKLESVDAEVNIHKIDDRAAKKLKLMGSPSVLMNGEDILPGEIPGIS